MKLTKSKKSIEMLNFVKFRRAIKTLKSLIELPDELNPKCPTITIILLPCVHQNQVNMRAIHIHACYMELLYRTAQQ